MAAAAVGKRGGRRNVDAGGRGSADIVSSARASGAPLRMSLSASRQPFCRDMRGTAKHEEKETDHHQYGPEHVTGD
jgi:hypothetical protein